MTIKIINSSHWYAITKYTLVLGPKKSLHFSFSISLLLNLCSFLSLFQWLCWFYIYFLYYKNHIVRILFINLNTFVSHESNLFSIHFSLPMPSSRTQTHMQITPSDMYIYLVYNFCRLHRLLYLNGVCFTLTSKTSFYKNEFGFYFVHLSFAPHFLFCVAFIWVFLV